MKKLLIVLLFGASQRATSQQIDTAKEGAGVRGSVAAYEAAWNRHDWVGLADQYDINATWVNWFGAYYIGKQDIQNHYEIVHKSYFKNSHYYTRSVEDISFVKPDLAIAHVRTGLSDDERYPGQVFEFRRTILMVKKNDRWLILAGQNAKLEKGIK